MAESTDTSNILENIKLLIEKNHENHVFQNHFIDPLVRFEYDTSYANDLMDRIRTLWIGEYDPRDQEYRKDTINRPEAIELIASELYESEMYKTSNKSELTYYYNDGFWHEGGEIRIKIFCEKVLNTHCNIRVVNEILAKVKRNTYIDDMIFYANPELIAVNNGIYNLKNKEFLPFSPEYFFLSKIPTDYNPHATCPKFEQFLNDILPYSEKHRATILEMIGYCLYRDYPIAQYLILNGEGRNGKGTLLNWLRVFLGNENVYALLLKNFSKNFKLSKLVGKMANLAGEMNTSLVTNLEELKGITGNDVQDVERKYFDSAMAKIYCKFIFANNNQLEITEKTLAIITRTVSIDFPIIFEQGNPKTDPHILEKISTPEERSGVLNLALIHLEKLLTRGCFSSYLGKEVAEKQFKIKYNVIAAWFDDRCEVLSTAISKGSELYADLCQYCVKYNVPQPKSDIIFYKRIIQLGISGVKKDRDRKLGVIFQGFMLKELANTINNGTSKQPEGLENFVTEVEKKEYTFEDLKKQLPKWFIEGKDLTIQEFKDLLLITYTIDKDELEDLYTELEYARLFYNPIDDKLRLI